MPVPSSVLDLSSTLASNSPSGSDTIAGTLDDYLRATQGIVAQEAQNKGWLPQVGSPGTPTYISASSFSVAGDQTSTFYPGRPIKCSITGAVRSGVIVNAAFSSVTTVIVILDGDIDVTLVRVDLGQDTRTVQRVENKIINPWFRYFQRNTTTALSAGTSGIVADGVLITAGTSGVVSATRQSHTIGQTVVPFEPQYFLRWDQTTGGTGGPVMKHHIEGVRNFAGQTVCVWFIAKVASSTLSVTPRVTQKFGSGGSPSSDVTTAGTAQTVGTTFKLYSTTIAVPSISGKTIGSTAYTDSCRIDLLAPDSTTFTLDIAAWGANLGTSPCIEPPKMDGDELLRCQRRYYKTFPVDTVPAQNVGVGVNGLLIYNCYRAGANAAYHQLPLPVPLRIGTSSVTTYSPAAVSAAWYNMTVGGASGAAAVGVGATQGSPIDKIVLSNAQAAGDTLGSAIAIHLTIDAEFSATT